MICMKRDLSSNISIGLLQDSAKEELTKLIDIERKKNEKRVIF